MDTKPKRKQNLIIRIIWMGFLGLVTCAAVSFSVTQWLSVP